MARQVGHGRKRKGSTSLNITSMMDMFTIILLFLLKSFSADGTILTNADDLILPNSISKKKPQEVNLQLAVSADSILIDNEPVESTSKIRNQPQEEFDTDTLSILDLQLKKHMKAEEDMVKKGLLTEVEGGIVVQLDKNMNFDILYKIMRLCGRRGYVNMKFAVMMREG